MRRLAFFGGRTPLFAAVLAFCLGAPAAASRLYAQTPPAAPAQVPSELLRNAEMIRERIRALGLTPDQVRARLRSAGYAPDLLDAYLGPDSAMVAPSGSQDVVNALRLLGVQPADSLIGMPADSLLLGSVPDSPGIEGTGLSLFGLDVFRRNTTQFQPVRYGPVPPSYHLGPGDVLVLVITGDVEFVHTLEVTRDGFIMIPQVGQVYVGNLTMAQLREVLYDRLGNAYSGIRRGPEATTKFDVTIARLRTIQVFVVGEVANPGSYPLSSVSTVLTALYAAGGPTERGNFRSVEVRRLDRPVATLDLYDYLLRGDAEGDIILEDGDVVFVPVHGTRATIVGAVVRPAIYELKEGETLAELVDAAGGFRPDAALDRISISRIAPPGMRSPGEPPRIVVDVALPDGVDALKAAPFPIAPGDSVTVFALADDARRGFVELNGNVYHPGTYGWSPGLRLSDVIRLAGGFRPATYAGRAHIERLNVTDSTRFILDVQLPEDSAGPFPDDVLLEQYDIVTIYGREEFRADRTVTIAGMVNEPGEYPFREGMTLRDVVLMARGLRDGAYLDSAEIARLPSDRAAGQLAVRIRVPLDSSYLFEPDSTTYPFLPGVPAHTRDAPEVALEPFDHVLILKQPEFELQRMVQITGEVQFPGTYALTHRDERISDLVRRAGGVLPTAYVSGASLNRALDGAGRVNIELNRAIDEPASPADLVLMSGDSLNIPEYNPVVRVRGAVNSPMSVQYRPGAGLDYYIENAGGYANNADEGRVSVRYANGSARVVDRSFLFFTSKPEPGPGSIVTVPVEEAGAGVNVTQLLGDLAQIVASVATVVIVLERTKN